MVSSTVPRFEERCPPVFATDSSRNSRNWRASSGNCFRSSARNSEGDWMVFSSSYIREVGSDESWAGAGSKFSEDDKVRKLAQMSASVRKPIQRLQSVIAQFASQRARTLNTQCADVGGFLIACIFAGGFA